MSYSCRLTDSYDGNKPLAKGEKHSAAKNVLKMIRNISETKGQALAEMEKRDLAAAFLGYKNPKDFKRHVHTHSLGCCRRSTGCSGKKHAA